MRILGISDGPDASATLCVDDHLVAVEAQASFDGRAHARFFPWEAIVDVLRRAECRAEEVDQIAIAGRFSPPFFVRRHPLVKQIFSSAFHPAFDLGVLYQALLRQSGIGALEADRAAEWLAKRMEHRGFQGRLFLVDVHTALANAAYRFQDEDDVLIFTFHPLGDGVSLAVHHGAFGQIDRIYEQKGFSALHVHLTRCMEAVGVATRAELWALADQAVPNPRVVDGLASFLRADGAKLSMAAYPFQRRRRPFQILSTVSPAVAAASVRENIGRAVCAVIQHHVRVQGISRVLLGGEVFDDPALVTAVRSLPEVGSAFALDHPGSRALSIGAAAYAAGLPMRSAEASAVDPQTKLEAAPIDEIVRVLTEGGKAAYFSGRSVLRPLSTGDRLVWSLDRGGSGLGSSWVSNTPLRGHPSYRVCAPQKGSVLEKVVEKVGAVELAPFVFAGRRVATGELARAAVRSGAAQILFGDLT